MVNRARFVPLVLVLLVLLPRPSAAQDPTAPFFDDTVLHEIRLAINGKDWQNLKDHFQENTYYPADFRWNDQVVRSVGIRSRGNGSRRPNKPGLRIDFNRYTANQTFLTMRSFILRNNSQDTTNMRERLSMAFFRRMGFAAMREAHAKLFINNEYLGLYTIVESPDKDFLQRNLGENTGHLYEFAFDSQSVAAGNAPFTFQFLGANPSLYVPVPFKPETFEDDPQGDVLASFIQAINDTGAAWRTAMAQFLDLSKFIRHLAVENFLAEEDGLTGDYGPNNFYIYRFVNTNKFQFLPWDKGNTFWATDFSIFRNINDGPPEKRNRLVVRALQEPDLRTLYLDTLAECAVSAAEGATSTQLGYLSLEVERVYNQIHAAALADTLIYTNAEFEQGVLDVKAFARDRSAVVQAQVAASR
jgi:spore coat protein CotH